ncbi:hypothetical protein J2S13_000984 [Oikeobacillus pervagus]|uniref:Competence protein ComN n=1 Tax=Oikeobacillus pervagus TaxID=1325931 RepID=A0AAJ1WIR2_9BACI|nr:post-transcriptional regulator [Oikeobacillus pervagus]MDQ0214588.1 hypothetical protein [Oikeobacillus pervagus]
MKKEGHPYDRFFYKLKPALYSKAEELELLGYDQIEVDSLWEYLTKKKWKKYESDVRVYQLVSDILSIKPGDYMNYKTIEAFRSPNWFTEINEEELQQLLQPNKQD